MTAQERVAREYLRRRMEVYRRCGGDLGFFLRAAWGELGTGAEYIHGRSIDAVSAHLMAVVDHAVYGPGEGRIQNLIISISPGSTKTLLASVCLPAWAWGPRGEPWLRFLMISHSEELAERDSTGTRGLIEGRWYQEAWGEGVKFAKDENRKMRYRNLAGGERMAMGITSGVTGEHGDVIVVDDPHPADRAMVSGAVREEAIIAWDAKIQNRVTDPRRAGRVIMHQRFHVDDLTGHVRRKREGNWVVLTVPFHFKRESRCVTPIYRDWREEEGELYWPERYDEGYYRSQLEDLGPYGVAAQLEQDPMKVEGGAVRVEWFLRFEEPEGVYDEKVCFWDTAQKAGKGNSPWCGLVVGRRGARYDFLNLYYDFHNYPEGERALVEFEKREGVQYGVIEDRSTGSTLLQRLPDLTAIPHLPFDPEGDKDSRFLSETPAFAAGKVRIPADAPWVGDYLNELLHMPRSKRKDRADVTSMALKYFRDREVVIEVGAQGEFENTEDWPEGEEGADGWGGEEEGW